MRWYSPATSQRMPSARHASSTAAASAASRSTPVASRCARRRSSGGTKAAVGAAVSAAPRVSAIPAPIHASVAAPVRFLNGSTVMVRPAGPGAGGAAGWPAAPAAARTSRAAAAGTRHAAVLTCRPDSRCPQGGRLPS